MLTALTALLALMSPVSVNYTVDGDTIHLDSDQYVRLVGVDAPETWECGYWEAKLKTYHLIKKNGMTATLVDPVGTPNLDKYDRLLRYVSVPQGDIGTILIRKGLADARYDSTDGYEHHPKQALYHRLDKQHPNIC